MSTQKLQVGRALLVIPTDTAPVPFPAVSESGTNTSVVASQLVDSTAQFVSLGITAGDIVYNTTDGTATTVNSVVSETAVKLSADIFLATTKSYVVYKQGNNDGCVLYVGTAGNITLETIGGDVVTLIGASGGQFLPIHVKRVLYSGTSCTNIIALW